MEAVARNHEAGSFSVELEPTSSHQRKPTHMTAGDIMSHPALTVQEDQSIQSAAAFLLEHHIQGAPVVDKKGEVAGVLSVTDIARYEQERGPMVVSDADFYRLEEQGRKRGVTRGNGFHLEQVDATVVRDVMTPLVICVEDTTRVPEIIDCLLTHHIHRVMVVKSKVKKLVGVVTETDLLRVFRGSGVVLRESV